MYDASNDIEDQNGLEVLRVVMDKAGKIPESAEFIWNIAMTNISLEKHGRLILCRNAKESKELYVKIDKSAWEYKRAAGKPCTGDLRQVLWEALDVETKRMIMQKGLENFTYKTLCSEILTRAELLARRDVVLSRSNDVVMGTSSLGPTMNLQADGTPLMPVEPPHLTGEQQQRQQ